MTEEESAFEVLAGGKQFKYTMKYVVHFEAADYPFVLRHNGAHCNVIDKNSMIDAVENFVKKCGLTQVTLWDTYRRTDRDISVSRIGRENV